MIAPKSGRLAWSGAGDQVQVKEWSRSLEKVGNSGEGAYENGRRPAGVGRVDGDDGCSRLEARRNDKQVDKDSRFVASTGDGGWKAAKTREDKVGPVSK